MNQVEFYKAKLEFETDSWDLNYALKNGEEIVVIDARSAEAYSREHIPGARNIPHKTITPELTAGLDKGKTYVTYCDGIGCNASTRAALKLAGLGFKVKELLGGIDWWRRDGYETHGRESQAGAKIECGC